MPTSSCRKPGILAGTLVLLLAGCTGGQSGTNRLDEGTPSDQIENPLEQAQEALAKGTDTGTCHTVLQQVNVHLSHQPEQRPAPLTEEQRRVLQDRKLFGLDADELAEVESGSFTLLDAQHLDLCFLLHDAARSLELEGLSQPEQAAAAFAWVVRGIRLLQRNEDLLPPQFVLRRGWGTARERALAYVALLEQLGIPGCILAIPAEDSDQPRLWACGALASLDNGKKAVLLFDPHCGLPLPGPSGPASGELAAAFRRALPIHAEKGRQIATLADVRAHPELLEVFHIDDKHRYDVSAAQLQHVRIAAPGMLSGLAPRMRYLEEQLTGMNGTPRLALDPVQLVAAWTAVAGEQGGSPVEVAIWGDGTRAQREFWPSEEGGTGKTQQLRDRLRELVPWGILPKQILELPGDPGRQLQMFFSTPFAEALMTPNSLRDQVLRGRLDEAAGQLVPKRDELLTQRKGFGSATALFDASARNLIETHEELHGQEQHVESATSLDQKINVWCDLWGQLIVTAQGNLLRAEKEAARPGGKDPAARNQAQAQADAVWKQGQEPLMVLLGGRGAQVRTCEVTYLLALCKQEMAERLQARVDRAAAGATEADVQLARDAWKDAVLWWQNYDSDLSTLLADLPEAANYRSGAAAARLLHARARAALGESAVARALLENVGGDLTPVEQTGRLYLVRQLQGQPKK
jgi:hypothetical protein